MRPGQLTQAVACLRQAAWASSAEAAGAVEEEATGAAAILMKWAETVAIVLPALRAVADFPEVWDKVVASYKRTLCVEEDL